MIVSMQRGGGSKDTWIPAAGPVDTFSLLPSTGLTVVYLCVLAAHPPLRVAYNLYWLGRYIERAEGIARLARGIPWAHDGSKF